MPSFITFWGPALFALVSLFEASSGEAVKAVRFDLARTKRELRPEELEAKLRRRGSVLQEIDNNEFLYYANITIGTPPQKLRLHVDTGSSDVWVESVHSKLCGPPKYLCKPTGAFNTNASSTFKHVNNNFYIDYVDYEFAKGEFGTDNFGIGGITVEGLQFGIGHEANSTEGVMGIGFPTAEAGLRRGQKMYDNLPNELVKQGFINSRAYSLWLNDPRSTTGEILFGAVDTAKYKGRLQTVPLLTEEDGSPPKQFRVANTGIAMTDADGVTMSLKWDKYPLPGIPVVMDSGTSYIYLPPTLAARIHSRANVTFIPKIKNPVIPCSMGNTEASIDFLFGNVSVRVQMHELIFEAFDTLGRPAKTRDGTPLCYFGILAGTEGIYTLGDSFLRSVYSVYDIDNFRMAFAPTRFNSTGSNIVEIQKGKEGLPAVEGTDTPKKKGSSTNISAPVWYTFLSTLAISFYII